MEIDEVAFNKWEYIQAAKRRLDREMNAYLREIAARGRGVGVQEREDKARKSVQDAIQNLSDTI